MKTSAARRRTLWAPSWSSVVGMGLIAIAMTVVAVSNLSFVDHSDERLFLGLAAVFVGGLALGVLIGLLRQRNMVQLHMAAEHPGVPVPNSPRG